MVAAGATGPVHSACTSCGLGFTTSRAVAFKRESRSQRSRSRRRGPDKDAQRELVRFARHSDQLLRDRAFPIFGLDATWQGRRWLGGAGSRDGEVDRIELAHGDVWDEGVPLLRVETRRNRTLGYDHDIAQEIAQNIWHRGAEHSAVRGAFTDGDPLATWSGAFVTVERQPLPCRFVVGGDWWGVILVVGNQPIKLIGRNISFDKVRLTQIEDVEPYLADNGGPVP